MIHLYQSLNQSLNQSKNTTLNISTLALCLGLFFSSFHSQADTGSSSERHPEVRTVEYVDLNRYAGLWHQIAYFPNRFQKNCTINTTAEYSLREDGKIQVINRCTKNNGDSRTIEGTAKVVDKTSQAKLGVKFFWFQPRGDYWIIDLEKNYEYAVVASANRRYFWILARSPVMDQKTYLDILNRAKSQLFDIEKIQITGKVVD